MARTVGVPYLQRGVWRVDLGSGPVVLSGVPGVSDASDLAYRAALQLAVAGRPSAPGPQLPLVAPSSVVTLRGVAIAWARDAQRAHTDGGQAWREQYTRAVVLELGGEALSAFAPPLGNVRIVGYHRHLVDKKISARTIRNRLSILGQILRYAAEHGSLSALPVMPRIRLPRSDAPYPLISERDLRRVRASLPSIERRTYLSVGFYLGLHAADIQRFSIDDLVGWPPSAWLRRNTKSSRFVPLAQFPIPESCASDLVDAVRALGAAPPRGLTGGIWTHASEQMRPICAAIGCVIPTGRVLRRSCVWELAARGWSERECAEYLGHVDQRMIREVYVRFPIVERPSGRQPWAQLGAPDNSAPRLLAGLS